MVPLSPPMHRSCGEVLSSFSLPLPPPHSDLQSRFPSLRYTQREEEEEGELAVTFDTIYSNPPVAAREAVLHAAVEK